MRFNKKIILFAFLLLLNFFQGQKFTKEQIIQDLQFIQEKIKSAHVNPYSYKTEADFTKQFSDIISKVGSRTSAVEFRKMVYPIFVNLSDDHAFVARVYNTDVILPLEFKYYQNRFFLTENFSSQELNLGDELLSVNGLKTPDLVEKCSDYSLGNRNFKKELAYNQFLYLIRNLCLDEEKYDFRFSSGKSAVFDKKTTKKDLPNYRINFQLNESEKGAMQHIKYKKIDSENGYLEVNNFSIRGRKYLEWQKDIDINFDQIKKDGVKNLYIDVRNNSGGNVSIGEMIIHRFNDKKYQKFSFNRKKSNDLDKQNSKLDKIDSTNRKILFPEEVNNIFSGKTYIIVGQKTFSAGLIFATTALDNQLATIIGETVEKGHPNQMGGVLDFETPNTKTKFSFSSGEAKRPDESKPNQLIPNIEIDLTNKKIGDIIRFIKENHPEI